MDIRPMAELQTSIARQEDVKRQEQREEKLRELSKRRVEERSRIEQENRGHSIAAAHETENIEQVDVQTHLEPTDADLHFHKNHTKDTDISSVSYFKDPNLGAKIDISS